MALRVLKVFEGLPGSKRVLPDLRAWAKAIAGDWNRSAEGWKCWFEGGGQGLYGLVCRVQDYFQATYWVVVAAFTVDVDGAEVHEYVCGAMRRPPARG